MGLVLEVTDTDTAYALDARGTVALTGFPGVAVSGAFVVRVSAFEAEVDETVAFADGSGDVTILFTAAQVSASGTDHVSVSGVGLTVAVLGQQLTADLAFTRTGTGFTVTVANLSLQFADGGAPIASFTGGTGSLTFVDATDAMTATLSGTFSITVPGLAFSGSLSLGLSTVTGSQYVRVTGGPLSLTIGGQSISFTTVEVARVTIGGVSSTRIAASGGTLAITATGPTNLLTATGVAGDLTITAAGVAGRLTVSQLTTAITGITFTGGLAVAVNTGAAAVGDLPAGPYLRVEVLAATLTVAGQSLTADITFERGVDSAGAVVVRAGLANASLSFVAGTTAVLSVTDGQGALLVTSAGFAATLSGTVAVGLPGVSLTGALSVQVKSFTAAVDTTVSVGGTDQSIVLPTGTYLRVRGENVVLDVAGQRIAGTVTVTRASGITSVAIADGSVDFGDGAVTLTGITATLTAGETGIWGSFTGTPALSLPGLSITATSLTVEFNTDTLSPQDGIAADTVRVGALGLAVAFAGVTLTGDIWVESSAGVLTVDISGGTASLGPVIISAINGKLVVAPDGVAGSLTATVTLPTITGITFGTPDFSVEVNTTPSPRTVGTDVLPAGPYLRAVMTGLTVTVGSEGSFTADVAITRSGTAAPSAATGSMRARAP